MTGKKEHKTNICIITIKKIKITQNKREEEQIWQMTKTSERKSNPSANPK